MPVLPDDVIEYLRTSAGRPLKARELARALSVPDQDYHDFKALLQQLENDGRLYRVQRQRYAAPKRINLLTGRLQTIRSGAGFVTPDDGGADLFIPVDSLNSAMDGDKVVARIEKSRRGGRREGSVIRILERARQTIVGTFHSERNFGFVVPEDPKVARDVFIPPGQEGGAETGQIVVVRVTNWGDRSRGPAGEVERVLGVLGDPGVDILAVIHGHELPLEFPAEVEEEAEAIRARGVTEEDLEGRRDLRDTLIFTIDPVDAKDHDDALSIRRLDDGNWEIGVHIADVSHYVREGSPIDAEALSRGTSVYMVDRTIPMLPHALSTDICSLVPDQDRLALSVIAIIDQEGKTLRHQLVRSVIRSRHKISYERAQAVLGKMDTIDPETDQAIHDLVTLSRVLRQRRAERGSLDFDLPEARVILNTRGEPTDIQRVERLESHKLIEDFMLLANEIVARRAAKARIPFVYRIHESPDESRLESLKEFVEPFGYRVGGRGKVTPKDLQKLLAAVEGKPEANLISTVVLRSMKQARYAAENAGHFGLAATHYAHFTSPIRRYPDLQVHRICTHAFIDRRPARELASVGMLPEIARISSERERVAVEAERDSIELKKVEFMQRHLGAEFMGTISGVAAFGFFVLLDEFFVDGLVHVSSLDDDYYDFVEEQYTLIGAHTGRQFRLGDRVRVQVARVNLEERKIDFLVVEQMDRAGLVPRRTRRRARR